MLLPWLIGIGITVPLYLGVGADFSWNAQTGLCYSRVNGNFAIYVTSWYSIGLYGPMALIGTLYLALFVHLLVKRRSISMAESPAAATGNRVANLSTGRRHVQIAKMLMISFVWFCVCFIPSPIMTGNFPWVYVKYPMLQLWMTKTLSICGYAASPVRM